MKGKVSNLPFFLLFLFLSTPAEAQHWEVETRGLDSNRSEERRVGKECRL